MILKFVIFQMRDEILNPSENYDITFFVLGDNFNYPVSNCQDKNWEILRNSCRGSELEIETSNIIF